MFFFPFLSLKKNIALLRIIRICARWRVSARLRSVLLQSSYRAVTCTICCTSRICSFPRICASKSLWVRASYFFSSCFFLYAHAFFINFSLLLWINFFVWLFLFCCNRHCQRHGVPALVHAADHSPRLENTQHSDGFCWRQGPRVRKGIFIFWGVFFYSLLFFHICLFVIFSVALLGVRFWFVAAHGALCWWAWSRYVNI